MAEITEKLERSEEMKTEVALLKAEVSTLVQTIKEDRVGARWRITASIALASFVASIIFYILPLIAKLFQK